jgi:hypothetical protein
MVQQHQHHFQQQQQQQQQSNEDIKRDLSDMCGQQSAGQQENMQTDHDADDSDLHHQHQQQQQQQQHKETQYISANCVVFMSYSGDTASVVDQHFSRALNSTQPESAGGVGGGGSSGSPYADASSAGSSGGGGSNNSQKTSSGISLVKSKSPNFFLNKFI